MIEHQSTSQVVLAAVGTALAAPYVAAGVPEHIPLVAVSGFCGGICRYLAARERIWPAGFASIVTGALTATFLWPVAEPLFAPVIGRLEMTAEVRVMFGGFVTGLLGLGLLQFFLDFFRMRRFLGRDDE